MVTPQEIKMVYGESNAISGQKTNCSVFDRCEKKLFAFDKI